jgi:uncharacterized protein
VTIRPGFRNSNVAADVPHLPPGEARSLQAIVERLVSAYRPQRIYLFGSRARNDGGSDSDFDLLVVVPDSALHEQTGSRLAYEALRGTGTAADIVVWTSSAFESRLPLAASLPATVVREGLLLYAA